MIQSYKASISRKSLKSGHYMPEKLALVSEEPTDFDADRRYFIPAVNLLSKIYEDFTR